MIEVIQIETKVFHMGKSLPQTCFSMHHGSKTSSMFLCLIQSYILLILLNYEMQWPFHNKLGSLAYHWPHWIIKHLRCWQKWPLSQSLRTHKIALPRKLTQTLKKKTIPRLWNLKQGSSIMSLPNRWTGVKRSSWGNLTWYMRNGCLPSGTAVSSVGQTRILVVF